MNDRAHGRLPESLSGVRALLDEAAVKRAFIPISGTSDSPTDIAGALGVPAHLVVQAVAIEADGDRLLVIAPAGARVDLRNVAALVGARRATLAGARRRGGRVTAAPPTMVSGLPTLIDRSLLDAEFLYGPSGDPAWVLRLSPQALRKVTHALVGNLVRGAGAPASSGAAHSSAGLDEDQD